MTLSKSAAFLGFLRTKGVIKVGWNSLGVLTNLVREAGCTLSYNDIELMQEVWLAAKEPQNNWILAAEHLPETEPNSDGIACAVIDEYGNISRARYMHDVYEGGEAKYWSEFTFSKNGFENEHYEINEKIIFWLPLPDSSLNGGKL